MALSTVARPFGTLALGFLWTFVAATDAWAEEPDVGATIPEESEVVVLPEPPVLPHPPATPAELPADRAALLRVASDYGRCDLEASDDPEQTTPRYACWENGSTQPEIVECDVLVRADFDGDGSVDRLVDSWSWGSNARSLNWVLFDKKGRPKTVTSVALGSRWASDRISLVSVSAQEVTGAWGRDQEVFESLPNKPEDEYDHEGLVRFIWKDGVLLERGYLAKCAVAQRSQWNLFRSGVPVSERSASIASWELVRIQEEKANLGGLSVWASARGCNRLSVGYGMTLSDPVRPPAKDLEQFLSLLVDRATFGLQLKQVREKVRALPFVGEPLDIELEEGWKATVAREAPEGGQRRVTVRLGHRAPEVLPPLAPLPPCCSNK